MIQWIRFTPTVLSTPSGAEHSTNVRTSSAALSEKTVLGSRLLLNHRNLHLCVRQVQNHCGYMPVIC